MSESEQGQYENDEYVGNTEVPTNAGEDAVSGTVADEPPETAGDPMDPNAGGEGGGTEPAPEGKSE